MILVRAVATELVKLVTLPATWIAASVGVAGSTLLAWLNASTIRAAHLRHEVDRVAATTAFDNGLLPAIVLVSVAAVVLGVTAMSSEYTSQGPEAAAGRQMVRTLTGCPRRALMLVAKSLAVALLVAATAWAAVAGSAAVSAVVIGEFADGQVPWASAAARTLMGTVYWVMLAWISLAVAAIARSGLVPLIVLIVNVAVLPVSLLLFRVMPAARYLPDMAGRNLFGLPAALVVPGGLAPLPGGVVMTAWGVGLLVIAGLTLTRRDA